MSNFVWGFFAGMLCTSVTIRTLDELSEVEKEPHFHEIARSRFDGLLESRFEAKLNYLIEEQDRINKQEQP